MCDHRAVFDPNHNLVGSDNVGAVDTVSNATLPHQWGSDTRKESPLEEVKTMFPAANFQLAGGQSCGSGARGSGDASRRHVGAYEKPDGQSHGSKNRS